MARQYSICKVDKTLLTRHISKSIEFSSEEKWDDNKVDRDDNRVIPRTGGNPIRIWFYKICERVETRIAVN
jgi:hypothetical protein